MANEDWRFGVSPEELARSLKADKKSVGEPTPPPAQTSSKPSSAPAPAPQKKAPAAGNVKAPATPARPVKGASQSIQSSKQPVPDIGASNRKRAFGFDYQGLGSLVVWRKGTKGKPDHYELAPSTAKAATAGRYTDSRVSIPQPLIDETIDHWAQLANLTPAERHSLTQRQMIIFLLLLQVQNHEQRDALIEVFDAKNKHPVLRKLADAALTPMAQKSDRALLEEIAEGMHQQQTAMLQIHKRLGFIGSTLSRIGYAIQRAVGWLVVDRLGWFKTSYPTDTTGVKQVLNTDTVLSMMDMLNEAGGSEAQRVEKKRETARSRRS